jgi:hypothetical protein
MWPELRPAAKSAASSRVSVSLWPSKTVSTAAHPGRGLHEKDPGVPHYLMFSYRQGGVSLGEANDGTVTVASQLRAAAQQGAMRVEGFNESHMSVLESAAVAARLNELLGRIP